MEGKLGDCGEAREETGLFASRIGAVPWTLRDVLLAAALFVPVGVGGSFGLGFALARLSAVGSDIQAVIVGSALLPASLVAGAWFFGMRRHGVSWASLGFRGATLGSLTLLPMIALAVGLTATGLYALLANALGADMLVPEQNLDKLRELDGIARLPTFAVVGLLAPFGEEVFFRGFLLAALVPVIGGLRGAFGQRGDILCGALECEHAVSYIRDGDAACVAVSADGFDIAVFRGACGAESAGASVFGDTV